MLGLLDHVKMNRLGILEFRAYPILLLTTFEIHPRRSTSTREKSVFAGWNTIGPVIEGRSSYIVECA